MGLLEGILYMMWRGIAIGIIISAPMGPVGILCVQRTLEKGRASGFFTGVGASISDLFYCLLTGFGLSFIEGFLKANQTVIQIFGSIVLILFGVYLFRSHPARKIKKPEVERSSKGKNVLGGFLFTFSNPLIIFLIIGLFARFEFFMPEISFGLYVVGYVFIILGALFWWWLVTFFVDKVRAHFNLRSMWLINKITGGIIMIFAVVGIITAFTGSAKAYPRKPLYFNSSRGFGEFSMSLSEEGPLLISNTSCDTIVRCMSLDDAKDFSFAFRCANLNNESRKKYSFSCGGKKYKVTNPDWGLYLSGQGKTAKLSVSTIDAPFDELQPVQLRLTAFAEGVSKIEDISEDVDFYTGQNSFLFRYEDEVAYLSVGNRSLKLAFNELDLGFKPEDIGFFISPGTSVSIDDICLKVIAEDDEALRQWSHFADDDVRESYFRRSKDPMEGEWELFDHNLEENDLRLGGNYRLACVNNEEGYDLIYIEGASKMHEKWTPGMTKASLIKTSFNNIYDVVWLDPAGLPVKGKIKAQLTSPGVLTFQFPDHSSSSIRLRKINGLG